MRTLNKKTAISRGFIGGNGKKDEIISIY